MMENFSTVYSFLQMGGYATYVWPAYGLAFVVLILNVFLVWRKQKKTIKELRSHHANSA